MTNQEWMKEQRENRNKMIEKNLILQERMMSLVSNFVEKTEERLKKETIISGKTLKMVSLSEKLFSVISTWG